MDFRDIFNYYACSKCCKYINVKTNKVINDYGFCSEDLKRIPYSSIDLDINAQIQALDYYLSNNNDIEEKINLMKRQLKKSLDLWNKMSDKNDVNSQDYRNIIDVVDSVSEEIMELGISYIEDYYDGLNEIEYVKDWCISNNLEYDNDSYELYVEQFKFCSRAFGIDTQEIETNNIEEYIKIMNIDIPSDFRCFSYDYPKFKHFLYEKVIIFKANSYNCSETHIFKNENWKSWYLINPYIRPIIEDLDRCYLGNDYYLLYNNTEKKYDYFDKNKKNEMLIFCLNKGQHNYAISIKKIIV